MKSEKKFARDFEPNPNKEPRDYQRKRLYDWEEAQFGDPEKTPHSERMSMSEIHDLIQELCETFSVHTPVLTDGRGRRSACFLEPDERPPYEIHTDWQGNSVPNTRGIIKMPKFARVRWVVLHELSHCFMYHFYGYRHSAHGSHFTTLYTSLLGNKAGCDVHQLRMSARRAGLRCVRSRVSQ